MTGRAPLAVAVLMAAGTIQAFAGLAIIGIGTAGPELIEQFLPPVPVDTAALGRGAVALGIGFVVIGAIQLAEALAIRMGIGWAAPAGVMLCGSLAITAVSSGVAAFNTSVAGLAPAALLLPLAGALLLAGVAYGAATVSLIRAARPRPPGSV
jgi:hypothetical protein